MSHIRHVPLVIIGAGRVTRAFLNQIAITQANLSQRYGLRLVPVALQDTSAAIFDRDGLPPDTLRAASDLKAKSKPLTSLPNALKALTPQELVKHVHAAGVERAIVVDATAAEGMDVALHQALDQGYGIVLANKRPLAGPWQGARRFFETAHARFEATVGAGLPIVATLRYLVETGDEVRYIEGSLSRTLEYICGRLEEGQSFSAAVNEAVSRGFTESELRDDLGGMDVARKALILARLAGWPLELSDIQVNPLYLAEMTELSPDAFLAELPRLNPQFAAYMGASSGVPRYIAEIRPERGQVGLRMVNRQRAGCEHGPVNHVMVTTRRYADYPLTLSGPGEGFEVTAAAVLQDCMQLALSLAHDKA